MQSTSTVGPPKFTANLAGIGLGCTGVWAITTSTKNHPEPKPWTSGSAIIQVKNQSSLALGMQLGLDSAGLVMNATSKGCDFQVDLGEVELKPPPGNHEPLLEEVINALLSSKFFKNDITGLLGGVACSEVDTLINTTFSGILASVSNKVRPYTKPRPKPPQPDYPAGSIDFREDKLLRVLDGMLNNVVGAYGRANLNTILGVFTNGTGMLSYHNESAPAFTANLSGLANLSVSVKEADAGNLTTWTAFDVLEPTGPITLASETATEDITLDLGVELNVTTLSKMVQAIPLSERFKLSINLTHTVMDTMLDLALDRNKVSQLTVADLKEPGCILEAIDTFNISWLSVNLSADDILLTSVSGGSMEKDIDAFVNNFFMLITNGFKAVVPASLNAFVSDPLRESINAAVNNMMAKHNCTPPPDPAASQDLPKFYTRIAVICAGLFFVVVSLVVRRQTAKRSGLYTKLGSDYGYRTGINYGETDSLGDLLSGADDAMLGGQYDQEDDLLFRTNSDAKRSQGTSVPLKRSSEFAGYSAGAEALNASRVSGTSGGFYDTSDDDLLYPDIGGGSAKTNKHGSVPWDSHAPAMQGGFDDSGKDLPLIMSPKLHWTVRYGVFGILCFCIALFVSANTAAGADVKAVMTIDDKSIEFPSFFTFSLINTVKDFWEAKVYFLSLLVAVLSGAWPYGKVVIMMFSWLLPPKILPIKRRETMLIVIDALGKWSLVDTFIMVMFQIAFHFKVEMPVPVTIPGMPDTNETLAVELRVVSDWGFTGFMIATMLSLVMSHVIVGAHRTAIADPPSANESTAKVAVASHVYTSKSGQQVKVTVWGKTLFTLLLSMTVGLVSWGVVADSFSFNFFGLVGYALEFQGPGAVQAATNYSIVSLGEQIIPASPEPHSFITLYILGTYFLFGVGVPLLHLIFTLLLWFVKMTKKTQKSMLVATEVLNAWSGLDVLVLALIASIIEIKSFVKFMVGDKCDLINDVLVKYMNKPLDGHDVCFDVDAELEQGCWILFAAVIVHGIVGNIAMSACRSVVRDREEQDHLGHVVKQVYADKPSCIVRLGTSLGFVRYE